MQRAAVALFALGLTIGVRARTANAQHGAPCADGMIAGGTSRRAAFRYLNIPKEQTELHANRGG